MEPEVSLPSSQELSTCTYPEPDQSSPQVIKFSAIFVSEFKIILESAKAQEMGVPQTCNSARFSLSLRITI
jgi:hypothetical protein